jgi:hypothetical protein
MKLIFWGLVAVVFCYAGYAVMMSAWSYYQVYVTVDEALALKPGEHYDARTLKRKVLNGANEAGVPLNDQDVIVADTGRGGVMVNVVWSFPVVIYKGETVLAVPMSVTRTREPDTAPAR